MCMSNLAGATLLLAHVFFTLRHLQSINRDLFTRVENTEVFCFGAVVTGAATGVGLAAAAGVAFDVVATRDFVVMGCVGCGTAAGTEAGLTGSG